MAETQVIKSFLVALGFKADEAALKKFNDGILSATKAVEKLAVAVSATALTVAIGVERFASNLEKLYFASQRTGTSAGNLKALGRAAEDFGSSAQEAMQAAEGLADFLRDNPGGKGQINNWLSHVGKSLTGDDEKDFQSIGELFAQNTRTGQGYLNTQLAGQWHIPRNLMLAMQNEGFGADLDSYSKRYNTLDWKKITGNAHDFEKQIRILGTNVSDIFTQLESTIQEKFGDKLKALNQYLEDHGDEIKRKLTNGLNDLLAIAEGVKNFLVWLYKKLVELDTATGGWSTNILATVAVLHALGGGPIIGGVLNLAAAFVNLTGNIIGAKAASGSLLGILGRLGLVAGAGYAGWEFGKYLNDRFDLPSKIGESLFNAAHPAFNAVETLTNLGWSKEQANGIVARLQRESNLIPSSVGDYGQAYGIAQWHPDRQAAFAKWAGHDIHGSSQEEQLRYIDYELRHGTDAGAREAGMNIRQTDNAADAYEYFTRMFERPKNVESEVAKGRATLELSNQTTINVQGSQSNEATAKAIADKQKQVNSDLVRNLKPTVQ